jgi:hypothetical protein
MPEMSVAEFVAMLLIGLGVLLLASYYSDPAERD